MDATPRDLVADALRAACEEKDPENPLRGAGVVTVGEDIINVLDAHGAVWFAALVVVP